MRVITLSILIAASGLALTAQKSAGLDAALQTFWTADTAERRDAAIPDVLASGANYDEVGGRLKTGRSYRSAKTGRIGGSTSSAAGGRPSSTLASHPASKRIAS